jgi:hypothetical protein
MLTYCYFLCSAPSFYSKLGSRVVASILAQWELTIGKLAGRKISLVVSEASLEELSGASASASLAVLGGAEAEISLVPYGSGECNLVSATGSVGFQLGASLKLKVNDVIFDSQRGWFPDSAWIHDIADVAESLWPF